MDDLTGVSGLTDFSGLTGGSGLTWSFIFEVSLSVISIINLLLMKLFELLTELSLFAATYDSYLSLMCNEKIIVNGIKIRIIIINFVSGSVLC